MLPSAPPRFASWAELVSSIVMGETGWRVYALQRGLTTLGRELVPDGVFGTDTRRKLVNFQAAADLVADGIAGGATQVAIIARLGNRVHDALPGVPAGLMRGFAQGEGANVLAASNWSVPGGVDLGTMQYRVYGPPYSYERMLMAFDPGEAMSQAGHEFEVRTASFWSAAWVLKQPHRPEAAKRCAILAHNWPAGARAIADHGVCSNPDSLATWVPDGVIFPDGAPVRTRMEWARYYAMGSVHGEAAIPKYVTNWS